ncbi:MAG: lipopolysaccharide biosynthesis protein, partial [Odoribacter sp.]|nr:lipopolysaccharide biosynthesis protein [Odoribacter sp.]
MSETLKNKTIKGLSWSFVEKFGQQIISFVSGLVLLYILTPEEYGLVAVLSIFWIVGDMLIDSGFNRGLINKKEATQKDYNTIFGFNIFISILIYLILYFSAPFIARFYEKPELIPLSRVLFLILPLNAFASIQNVLLIKRVNFKTKAKVTLLSILISSTTAIILAYNGFGVWTIVIQLVVLAFCKSLLFWIYNNWRPSFHFRIKTLKELFPFGSKLLAVSLLNAFSKNIYSPLIGYYYNMEQTGYYDQANKYQTIPISIIGDTFRSVSVPVFSEAADNILRLKQVIHKMMKTISFCIFPIIFCLIIIIKPLFTILQLADKWAPAIPTFQILCFGGIFYIFYIILLEAIVSKGRSGIALGIEICSKIFIIISILLFLNRGIEGLAMS